MKALILAGGFGVRLREIVHGRPKHLMSVNGQPFLRHLLKLLKKSGVTEVVISVGYLAQYIIDEFTKDNEGLLITFSEDDRPSGTAGAIKKAHGVFTDDFLILNGDTYIDINYQQLLLTHKECRADFTIVATDKHKDKGGVILIDEHKNLTNFMVDGHGSVPVQGLRNTGVYAASPNIFAFIPDCERISLEKDTLPILLTSQQVVKVFPVHQEFLDVGSSEGYLEAQQKLT